MRGGGGGGVGWSFEQFAVRIPSVDGYRPGKV